jgi:hypothetical protein
VALGEESLALVLVRREGGGKPSIGHCRVHSTHGTVGSPEVLPSEMRAAVRWRCAMPSASSSTTPQSMSSKFRNCAADAGRNAVRCSSARGSCRTFDQRGSTRGEYAATRLLAPGANCGNLANLNVRGYAVLFNACARAVHRQRRDGERLHSDAHIIARLCGKPEFVARTATVRVSSL